MPKATVSTDATTYELKSLPGGYVKIRALSYGKKKERADLAGRMYSSLPERPGMKSKDDNKLFMEAVNRASTHFDFSNCVVEHNLENDDGSMLNFQLEGTLDILDPRVGGEIENLLARINGDDEDLRDFTALLSTSSPANDGEAKPQPASKD
jgi:hypothetical protein